MIKRGLILFSKFTKEDQLLMLSRLEELGLSKLLDYRPLFLNSGGPYEANPFEAAQGAEVLINFMTPAAKLEPILKANPGVRWIHACSTGVENMMTPFIKEHPSILTNNKGGLSGSMAEMVLSQVLRQAKRSAHWEEMKRKGVWQQGPVYGVKGKTIGVVGYGNIGEEIGRISKVGFGMKVLGLKRDWGIVGSLGKSYLSGMYNNESVESLLSQSDFVVGVLPKTPETNDYFDQRKFSMMKPGSFFMNIGRGNSVVEADLIAALETDALSGAYLDVFQQEPLPSSHKLWTTKNLFLTPHCADTQFDNKEVMYNNLMKNLELYSKGQPLINVVNKSKGY